MIDVDDQISRHEALEDVARDDAPHRLRPPDTNGSEQLAVGDKGQPVRAAFEAAVQAPLDEGDGAGRRRLRGVDDGRGMAGLLEQLGEPRRLIRGEDDPRAVDLPALDGLGDRAAPPGGELRLAPAEHVAGRQATGGERATLRSLRFPRQLERPAGDQPGLPRPRADVRRRPVLRQLAALDQFGAPLIGLAPEEVGGLGDVAGLVDDEERVGSDVVQAARRGEERCPDLRGVADVQRPRRLARLEPPTRSAARRSGSFAALRPSCSASPPRTPKELRRGEQGHALQRPDGPLIGWVECPE